MQRLERRLMPAKPTGSGPNRRADASSRDGTMSDEALVDKALDVLEALASSSQGLVVREVAVRVGVRRELALTLLSALEKRGFADREPQSGLYSIGARLLELAATRAGARASSLGNP